MKWNNIFVGKSSIFPVVWCLLLAIMQTGASRRAEKSQSDSDYKNNNNQNNNISETPPPPPVLNMSDSEDEELDKEAVGRAVRSN